MRLKKLPLLLAITTTPLWLAACSNPDPAPTATDAPSTEAPTGEAGKTDDAPVAGLSPDAVAPTTEPAPATTPAPATSEVAAGEAAASGDPNAAAAEGDARQRIERLLGDPQPYEQVFNDLQRGIAAGDRVAVGKLMRYPLRATIAGNNKQIANEEAFQRAYADIVTPAVAKLIAEQRFDTLFVNGQGVMLGQGEVWITGVCKDSACAQSEVKVNNIGQ
jgi:hypothetical protein